MRKVEHTVHANSDLIKVSALLAPQRAITAGSVYATMAAIKVLALWISIIIFVQNCEGQEGRGARVGQGYRAVIRLTTYI